MNELIEILKEAKEYKAFIIVLLALFAGIFIYWINSDFVKDIKASQREGARMAVVRANMHSFETYMPERTRLALIKKYGFSENETSPVVEFQRTIRSLEALNETN